MKKKISFVFAALLIVASSFFPMNKAEAETITCSGDDSKVCAKMKPYPDVVIIVYGSGIIRPSVSEFAVN